MLKNLIIGYVLMFIVQSATSQSLNSYLKMPAIAPSSPDAGSIEKFGNIPVDYSTGNPDISIPLWKINCGEISWPISISYHGGGIKVDEIASSIGLGWTLNGPGVITRAVLGRPDEESNSEPDFYSVTAANYDYLFLVKNGQADTQLDMYTYNFNGRSGKFFIKQNGDIFQQPYTTMKIVKNSPTSFTITDEDGNIYLFDQYESTTVSSTPLQNYISSWYLSKVQTPDTKQSIDFVYASAGSSKTSTYSFSQPMGTGIKEGDGPGTVEDMMYGLCGSAHYEETFTSFIEQTKTDMTTNTLKLSQINFPNGSIKFTQLNDRLDIDGTGKNRITEIGVYNQPANTLLKKFTFSQSYFYYKPAAAVANVRQYRLRLDTLYERSGSVSKPYAFQYNTTNMVPRENFGQDKWGFNNGVEGNLSLIQTSTVPYINGTTYYMGNADRSVNTTKMQACLLTSITWPTGGKTVYTFEPHQYQSNYDGVTGGGAEAHATGSSTTLPAVTTFTYPAQAQSARISVNISKYNYPGAYQRPNVELKDLTTGVTVYYADNPDIDNSFVANDPITLVAGHNYELKAMVFTTVSNVQLDAVISVSWVIPTSTPVVEQGSGLRIKEIKNYTAASTPASTETYEYVMGTPLTPVYYINKNYNEVVYQIGFYEPVWCSTPYYFYSKLCRIYLSSSAYPISMKAGSPVMYSKVTKYFKDEASADNGKQEYVYDIIRDAEAMSNEVGSIGLQLVSNDWRNGFLKSELTYKKNGANYQLIKKTENEYAEYKADVTYSLRANEKYIHTGTDPDDPPHAPARMDWYAFPINSGSKKVVKTIETHIDNNGNQLVAVTNNEYTNPLNDFITKTIITGSDNVDKVTTMKYPTDFSVTGNVYEKMKNRNILSPLIELKEYAGTTLVATIKNNYKDWNNDQLVLAPETVESAAYTNASEIRLRYVGYSDRKKSLSVRKENDVTVSYIWDFDHQLPVAEINGASQSDIAYTSFEADGKGNWNNFTGTITAVGTEPFPPTGKKYYNLTATATLSKTVTNGQIYIVSYWRNSTSPFTINGGTSVSSVGRTIGEWTYHEHKVTTTSTTLTITGTGKIDEVRLYPASARMTTYTYEPLMGITSQCDANNRITYYEYDGFGRLKNIRDQEKNVIKTIDYQYQQAYNQ